MEKNTLNRREALLALSAAGAPVLSAAGARVARCAVLDHTGQPVPADQLRRFHICDALLRPFETDPQFDAGEIRFEPASHPFRIAVPLVVPGFGHVFVYADNRGRGHTPKSLAGSVPLLLNYEFAADRLSTVRKLIEECRRSGLSVSANAMRRVGEAEGLLEKAGAAKADRQAVARLSMQSLRESLWAGEMVVFERAQQLVAKRGPRPGFLFGCNAFAYPQLGKAYADRFEALLNYATLPFYHFSVEPVQGKLDYSTADQILGWLEHTNIISKGHTFIFFSSMQDWLKNKPYDETKRLCIQYIRQSIGRYRHKIHVWDVINEAHLRDMPLFTKEQHVDLTASAVRVAREADPTCCRIVNCCCTWSEYMSRLLEKTTAEFGKHTAGQQCVYDYLKMVRDAKIDFEVLGLQYYYAGRDMLEVERSIETFKDFGKPIHITELGISSSSDFTRAGGNPNWRMVWHGEKFSETAQADWVEQFYTMAYSKPYIEAVTYWQFGEPQPGNHHALLRTDITPKESYQRLKTLLAKWRGLA